MAVVGRTGWLVGGAVTLAVILGIFMMSSRTDNPDMATNDPPATWRTRSFFKKDCRLMAPLL